MGMLLDETASEMPMQIHLHLQMQRLQRLLQA
jgi:hypothetical protein